MSRIAESAYGDVPVQYPSFPGSKTGGTSKDAARAVSNGAAAFRQKVLSAIRTVGEHGLTADEVATLTGRDRFYVRPRLSEMARLGLIEPTGERRANQSGLSAAVWRVK